MQVIRSVGANRKPNLEYMILTRHERTKILTEIAENGKKKKVVATIVIHPSDAIAVVIFRG